jgi:hypothetical protein
LPSPHLSARTILQQARACRLRLFFSLFSFCLFYFSCSFPSWCFPGYLTVLSFLQLFRTIYMPLPLPEMQVDGEPKALQSPTRKLVLLVIFCLAQFLDGVNNSSLLSALPALDNSMGMTSSQSTWVISAFQLTLRHSYSLYVFIS